MLFIRYDMVRNKGFFFGATIDFEGLTTIETRLIYF